MSKNINNYDDKQPEDSNNETNNQIINNTNNLYQNTEQDIIVTINTIKPDFKLNHIICKSFKISNSPYENSYITKNDVLTDSSYPNSENLRNPNQIKSLDTNENINIKNNNSKTSNMQFPQNNVTKNESPVKIEESSDNLTKQNQKENINFSSEKKELNKCCICFCKTLKYILFGLFILLMSLLSLLLILKCSDDWDDCARAFSACIKRIKESWHCFNECKYKNSCCYCCCKYC